MPYWIETAGNSGMLIEAPLREVEKLERDSHRRYRRVYAPDAHRWVRDGRTHSTSLWIDADDRIRRAG